MTTESTNLRKRGCCEFTVGDTKRLTARETINTLTKSNQTIMSIDQQAVVAEKNSNTNKLVR